MNAAAAKYELPAKVDGCLAALSRLYAQDDKRDLQELLVNAQIRVHEGSSYDNLDGGTFGHTLYLVLPEPMFLNVVKRKAAIQNLIRRNLNELHSVQNEYIDAVFLEMDAPKDHDWRRESGLLVDGKRTVTPDTTKRIWGDDGFRVFLSHKSQVKKETADLKDALRLFGVTCFVAHEDIHPTKAWQDEIENALASMDAFVALMTDTFHESDWTDQEVGFALARGVPVIAVRLGRDPYGFIGKFQALTCGWEVAAGEIAKILIRNDRMLSAYSRALHACSTWNMGNFLAKALDGLETLSASQAEDLAAAYNASSEIRGSWAFSGTRPNAYGPGLVALLNRLGPKQFVVDERGLILATS